MAYITQEAPKQGVSVDLALYIAEHESRFGIDRTGDETITCTNKKSPFYGKPVYARGVFQFTRCYYWWISDAQAFDNKFNIDLALPLLKDEAVCKKQFTTCRWYYSSGK